MDELQSKVEGRDAELSKLRDKINSLTISVSDSRKELEVKVHKVLSICRKAFSSAVGQVAGELTSFLAS